MKSLLTVTLLSITSLFNSYLNAATVPANPAITSDSIYVSDHGIHRFSRSSQSLIWSYPSTSQSFEITTSPTILLTGTNEGLIAINKESGQLVWQHWLGEKTFTPMISDKQVIVTTVSGLLMVLNLDSGRIQWKKQLTGWLYPPALTNSLVITGGQTGDIWAVDINNGNLRWWQSLDNELVYRPVIVDDTLIATTFSGTIFGLRPHNGKFKWQRQLNTVSTSPVALGSLAISGNWSNAVEAFNSQDGTTAWKTFLLSAVHHTPRLQNERLIVSSVDHIYILNSKNGRLLQQHAINQNIVGTPLIEQDQILVFEQGKVADRSRSAERQAPQLINWPLTADK